MKEIDRFFLARAHRLAVEADVSPGWVGPLAQVGRLAGRFPQVAGLKFTFATAAAPGQRISNVEVRGADGRFAPIDPDKIYGVVSQDYLRGGGDGYKILATNAIKAYDYGPGLGVGAEAFVFRNGRPIVDLRYRYTWIDVRNGSIWNPDESDEGELEGSDATHQVHRLRLRVNVPITRNFSLGADGIVFYRDSVYTDPRLEDVTQRNPEVRLYVTWDLGYTRRRWQRAEAAQN